MAKQLENYALGKWTKGSSEGQMLYNAITGEEIATASSQGLDFGEMMDYARTVGSPALRKMTFQERGLMLKRLAMYLMERKEEFYAVSWATGATRADSWVDIEGGIGNLFANASLRRQFPDLPYYVEGETAKLSKNGTFLGTHICVPKRGVAIHINAFNFPVWGMLEKVAVNLLAGVPGIVKPATITSFLTETVVRAIIDSNILPDGALQLITGSANGILEHVEMEDVVTFTGSASTGQMLKAHPRITSESVPFNLEADSLNACVLGEDAVPGTAEFDLFIKEVTREMTTKAGQKCTAVRRILVPTNLVEDVQIALGKRLAGVTIGDPNAEGVRMGALAGAAQVKEVREKVEELAKTQEIVFGDLHTFDVVGADKNKGSFMSPILFLNTNPFVNTACHDIEAFGPVSTIIPYKNIDEAIELVRLGKGSLVCSIVTADNDIARDFVVGAASMHGRILVLNAECAKESTGHGSPLPLMVHGGPGRAGGGEEMGGKRGVLHYMQRTAIQGSPNMLTAITEQYQYGADYKEEDKHPFAKYFEEIKVGDTLITANHTVTETDLTNFANVSGDNFYAHMDATSLEGTIFEQRVAHGYFVLSKAAGLFVLAKKGPVLLNYGVDECRFVKPVYPGTTIGVRFTCKEKVEQEKRDEEDIAKGIVKWLVDVYDQTGETVAIATILTMVKKNKSRLMEAFVQSTLENGVGTITFFHPQSNSMPGSQLRNLAAEIEKLGRVEAVKVIVLKSEGDRTFCAGASFDELISIKDRETGLVFFSGFAAVINAMRKAPKFVLARIQGKAVGGGVGIASAADYTFATEFAAIKLSELAVGIGPFVVGPAVERKVGTSAFTQLAINATEFQSAQWAKEKGLYADVFASIEEMDQAIEKLAATLAKSNPEAMKHLKEVAWVGTENWDQLLIERAQISGDLVLSEFTVNAINQFKSK